MASHETSISPLTPTTITTNPVCTLLQSRRMILSFLFLPITFLLLPLFLCFMSYTLSSLSSHHMLLTIMFAVGVIVYTRNSICEYAPDVEAKNKALTKSRVWLPLSSVLISALFCRWILDPCVVLLGYESSSTDSAGSVMGKGLVWGMYLAGSSLALSFAGWMRAVGPVGIMKCSHIPLLINPYETKVSLFLSRFSSVESIVDYLTGQEESPPPRPSHTPRAPQAPSNAMSPYIPKSHTPSVSPVPTGVNLSTIGSGTYQHPSLYKAVLQIVIHTSSGALFGMLLTCALFDETLIEPNTHNHNTMMVMGFTGSVASLSVLISIVSNPRTSLLFSNFGKEMMSRINDRQGRVYHVDEVNSKAVNNTVQQQHAYHEMDLKMYPNISHYRDDTSKLLRVFGTVLISETKQAMIRAVPFLFGLGLIFSMPLLLLVVLASRSDQYSAYGFYTIDTHTTQEEEVTMMNTLYSLLSNLTSVFSIFVLSFVTSLFALMQLCFTDVLSRILLSQPINLDELTYSLLNRNSSSGGNTISSPSEQVLLDVLVQSPTLIQNILQPSNTGLLAAKHGIGRDNVFVSSVYLDYEGDEIRRNDAAVDTMADYMATYVKIGCALKTDVTRALLLESLGGEEEDVVIGGVANGGNVERHWEAIQARVSSHLNVAVLRGLTCFAGGLGELLLRMTEGDYHISAAKTRFYHYNNSNLEMVLPLGAIAQSEWSIRAAARMIVTGLRTTGRHGRLALLVPSVLHSAYRLYCGVMRHASFVVDFHLRKSNIVAGGSGCGGDVTASMSKQQQSQLAASNAAMMMSRCQGNDKSRQWKQHVLRRELMDQNKKQEGEYRLIYCPEVYDVLAACEEAGWMIWEQMLELDKRVELRVQSGCRDWLQMIIRERKEA